MLVGTVRVLMADEISTGLDSATTFQIIARLKSMMALQPTFLVCVLFWGYFFLYWVYCVYCVCKYCVYKYCVYNYCVYK